MKNNFHHVGILLAAVALLLMCATAISTAQDFVLNGSGGSEVFRVTTGGNVGIKTTTTPLFPLTFNNSIGDKIALTGGSTNHYGFGLQSNLLQMYSASVSADIAFGYGSSASFTERMRVKGNGNVGIGTVTPTAKLEAVAAALSDGIRVTGTTGAYNPAFFLNDGSTERGTLGLAEQPGAYSTDAAAGDIVLRALTGRLLLQNGSDSSVIAIIGNNVAIGTMNPDFYSKLFVRKSGGRAGNFISEDPTGAVGFSIGVQARATGVGITEGFHGEANDGTTNYGLRGTANGPNGSTSYGVYGSSGGLGTQYAGYFSGNLAYTGSLIPPSDARFKEKVAPVEDALSKLIQLKPHTYEFSSNAEYKHMNFSPGKHFGLIAQEVEKIFPELVEDAVHPGAKVEGKEKESGPAIKYKGVKYLELIPILISAVQSQQKEIQELQQRVNELSNRK